MKKSVLILTICAIFLMCVSCGEKTVLLPSAKDAKVLFYAPQGEVYQPNNIIMTFNAPMIPITTIGKKNKSGPLEISPSVEGRYQWLGTQTVSFIPKKPFPFSTEFSVKLCPQIKNINDQGMSETLEWKFQTARPELISSIPTDDSENISLNENVLLIFNQPVDPEHVATHTNFYVTNQNGKESTHKFEARRPTKEEWKDKDETDLDRAVYLISKKKFPMSAKIDIIIDKKLRGIQGTLDAGKSSQITFSTYNILNVDNPGCMSGCVPGNSIYIKFNNPVVPKEAIKHIKIEPEVKISNESDWETEYFSINGNFKPNTIYKIAISKDLKDIFDTHMEDDYEFDHATENYEPYISSLINFGVVESSSPKEVFVSEINVNNINVIYKNFKPDEIIPKLEESILEGAEPISDNISGTTTDSLKFETTLNKKTVMPISLEKALHGTSTGIILLDVYSPQVTYKHNKEDKPYHNKSLIQVTNIGITGKLFEAGTVVWLTSLDTGLPIANAKIEIRNSENKVIAEGTSGTDGIIKVNLPKKEKDSPKSNMLYIFAYNGDDFAFSTSNWDQGFSPWEYGIYGSYTGETSKAYLFTERGIYKPGETIHFKAIFRKVTDNGIIIPPNLKGRIIAKDSRGREFFSRKVDFNEFGSTNAEIEIPKYVATGYTSLRLEMDDEFKGQQYYSSVNIEIYKPAEFKISMQSEKESIIAGKEIKIDLNADYLFGQPMKESDLTWSIYRNKDYFWSEEYPAYQFAQSFFDKVTDEQNKYYGYMEIKGKSKGKTNNDGKYEILIPTKASEIIGTTLYSVEATVTDINKKNLSSRTAITVHPADFYIGIDLPFFIIKANEELNANFITLDTDKKLIHGKKIKAKLFKREWHTARKKAVVGFSYETKPVDNEISECTIKSEEKPVQCAFTPKSSGFFIIRAESTDSNGNKVNTSTCFYASGEGIAGWMPADHDRIELIADKKTYTPGETAKILIKSPFKKSQALITYEREGVQYQTVENLTGFAPTISVPIKDNFIPNFYVSVVLIRGRIEQNDKDEATNSKNTDEGRPRVKIGYINLPVTPESKELTVEIKPDKEKASPGDNIDVSLKVIDKKGNPVKTELTLMAVDMGSLILTGYKTPNPFSTFYSEIGLGVTTTDSRVFLIGRRHFGEKGEPQGGGGGLSEESVRSKFLTVAYWNPSMITDDKGNANFSFTLPDNLTTYKIMAVANNTSMFGNGESAVISSKPFMIRSALPYFAGRGDSFQTGIVIHNYTDEKLSGKLFLEASGIIVDDDTQKDFTIKAKGKVEIFYRLKAEKTGTATLTFKAETENARDGITLPLEIKLTRPKEVFTSYAEITSAFKEVVDPLTDVYPDIGGLEISISSTAMNGLEDASMYLINYPYECLEQKISRAMGMMIYYKIADEFNLLTETLEKYQTITQNVIYDLYKNQKWDGGFSFWPKGKVSPYLTIYATEFLGMASKLGYNTDKKTYNNAVEYLQKLLRWDAKKKNYDETQLDNLKTYALYVLTKLGKPDTGYAEHLFKIRDSLSFISKLQIYIIMQDVLPEEEKSEFIRSINNNLMITATEAHYQEKMPTGMISSDYVDAYIMSTLLKLDPENILISKLARYLLNHTKQGHWLNTHTTAAVLRSLYTYITTHEEVIPDFLAIVKLGEKELIKEQFEGRSSMQITKEIPIQELIDLKTPTDLTFTKDGNGILYERARLTYALTETPLPPMEQGFTIFKKIEHYDKDKIGEPFERGDLVNVNLQFVTVDTRNYIVINDPLPAGLEAINFSLSTSQHNIVQDKQRNFHIDHMEIYGDKVLIFANHLEPGAYYFNYLAAVTTKGTFGQPPASVEEMYNPEIFGRTMTETFEVK